MARFDIAALGWDVNNVQGFEEPVKEVVHEDKVKVGGVSCWVEVLGAA